MQPLNNPKHEAFAFGMATGKTLAAALEAAGYKPHPASGAKLLKNSKIADRVSFLKNEIALDRQKNLRELSKQEGLTRQWVLEKLMKSAKISMGEQETPDGYQHAGAHKALELLGKELGMFIERKEEGKPGEFAELDELTDTDLVDIARRSGSRAIEAAFGSSGSTGVH
jgi:hypothetical protein